MNLSPFFLFASLICLAVSQPAQAQAIYHTGNSEAVSVNHLPGLVLAGGGSDNDDAMQWMLERADGGDIVVLRASGADGYNSYFYSELGVDVNSVTTIVIQNTSHANNPEVISIVNNAEVVFIAGGDQWNYINRWRDSALLEALNTLISEKQITIGGTSAGMSVLGEVVFTAENASVWSSEALGNPYHWRVKLEKEFLTIPFMAQTVTDTHYETTQSDGLDRKGRHAVFMARMVTDWGMTASGIGVNEYTAIAVDEFGVARVFGEANFDDYAFFLQAYGGEPEQCVSGTPLTWNNDERALLVYKVKGLENGNNWFDINGWRDGSGGEWQFWFVQEGGLHLAGNTPGDANCDGIINILDVISLINFYLGFEPELFCFPNADVNGDGIINSLDVIAIFNIYASQ